MYSLISHLCAGRAHLVSGPLIHGWNLYCCNRCGNVFYKWITPEMLKKTPS